MKTHARVGYLVTVTGLAAILAMLPPRCRAQAATGTAGKEVAALKAQIEGYNKEHNRTQNKQVASPPPATDEFTRAVNDGYDLVIINGALRWREKPAELATIKTVVALLGSRYREANIVYAPELTNVEIPDLKLRAHDLPEMLEALRVASGNRFDWMGPGSPGLNMPAPKQPRVDPNTGLPTGTATVEPDKGLFVLSAPARTGQNERVVEALNIREYVEHKIFEDFNPQLKPLTAGDRVRLGDETAVELEDLIIETTAGFRQTSKDETRHDLKFQYHAGAMLLVVIGPRDDVAVARKVVSALTEDGARGSSFSQQLTRITGGTSGGNGGASAAADAEPVFVEAIPLKFAKVSSAWAATSSLLKDKRSKVVFTDERTKTLIVMATKTELSAVKKAIEELDKSAKPYVGDNPVIDH